MLPRNSRALNIWSVIRTNLEFVHSAKTHAGVHFKFIFVIIGDLKFSEEMDVLKCSFTCSSVLLKS